MAEGDALKEKPSWRSLDASRGGPNRDPVLFTPLLRGYAEKSAKETVRDEYILKERGKSSCGNLPAEHLI